MAGRRRSLLDRARPAPSVVKGGAPSDDPADEAAAEQATDVEALGTPPPAEDRASESAPGEDLVSEAPPAEDLVSEAPPAEDLVSESPSDPVGDLVSEGPPTRPPAIAPARPEGPYAEVSDEGSYQHEGSGPEHDTSPIGWGSSVHDGFDPIDDFFDTSKKSTPPGKTQPQKDPARPVARDAGPAWQDPMGIPGPPQLPGLSDRFTPPPVERKSPAGADDRPAYSPTPRPQPDPDPRAGRRKPETLDKEEEEEEEAEVTGAAPTPFGLPRYAILPGIVAIGLILVIAVVVIVIRLTGDGDSTTIVVAPRPLPVPTLAEPAPGGLEVRATLRDPNGGGVDTATPGPEVAPVPAGTASPAPAPAPAPGPAPVAAPAPKPRPAPSVAPAVPVTRTGTLRVRSNRKVLVFVNGRAMGHAPLDLPLVPGDYTLSAALPSRPDTEQTKVIELSAGETERVDFNY